MFASFNVWAQWRSGLERWTGDRVILCSNPAAATSLWNFDNPVFPTLLYRKEDSFLYMNSCRFL